MGADTLLRLFAVCGALLYIGLSMATDPANFARLLGGVAVAIHNFRLHFDPRQQLPALEYSELSRRGEKLMRSSGVILIVIALLPFVSAL